MCVEICGRVVSKQRRFPLKDLVVLGTCVALCLVGAGCGPSGLTRERAKEMIQQQHMFESRVEAVFPYATGVRLGYWKSSAGVQNPLLPAGKKLFEGPWAPCREGEDCRLTTNSAAPRQVID